MSIVTVVGVLLAAYGGAGWLLRRGYVPEVTVDTGSALGARSAIPEELSRP